MVLLRDVTGHRSFITHNHGTWPELATTQSPFMGMSWKQAVYEMSLTLRILGVPKSRGVNIC